MCEIFDGKKLDWWKVVLIGLCVAVPPLVGHGAELPEKRVALVIGNNAYRMSPLRNSLNDAGDMRAVLEKLGFTVMPGGDNVGKREMERLVTGLGDRLSYGGIGLFYYAGHAVEYHGVNYLIPINSGMTELNESELERKAVNASMVVEQLARASNDLNILILDACRDDPLKRGYGLYSRGIEKLAPPGKSRFGSVIIYSTAPGKLASDGMGRNGVFTKHLLRHIQTPGLEIEGLLKRVAIGVEKETNRNQEPWHESNLKVEFRFNNSMPAPDPPNPPEYPAAGCNILMEIWKLPEIEQKTGSPPFPTITLVAQATGTLYKEACERAKTRVACQFFGKRPSEKEFKQAVHRMYCDRLGELAGGQIRVEVQIEFYKKFASSEEG
jgi:hypothetical protein